MTRYRTYHSACMDPSSILPGPGDLVILARQPMALIGPEPDHLALLEAGAPLFIEAATPCLRTAVLQHCRGVGAPSVFRDTVTDLVGPDWGMIDERPVECRVDAWIEANTLVSLRRHEAGVVPPEDRVGWLNPQPGKARRARQGER